MIRTLTFRGRLDGKDGAAVAEAIRAHVGLLVRQRNTIRGARVVYDSDVLDLHLRISGVDRWRIAREARKLATYIMAAQRVAYSRPLEPIREVTEPGRRSLTLEQGRTPQSVTGGRRSRTDPQPTDSLEWWGDPLPPEA